MQTPFPCVSYTQHADIDNGISSSFTDRTHGSILFRML